jgi:hypothetical protein
MTPQQEETVARLARLMWLLSDDHQVAPMETICLADLYAEEIKAEDGMGLITVAAMGRCRIKWALRKLQKREDKARQFAERVLSTPEARAAMVRAWAKCARKIEEANKEYRLKAGRPSWVSYEEYVNNTGEVEHAE